MKLKELIEKFGEFDARHWIWDMLLYFVITAVGWQFPQQQAIPYFYLLLVLRTTGRSEPRSVAFPIGFGVVGHSLLFLRGNPFSPSLLWIWAVYLFCGLSVFVFFYSKRLRQYKYRRVYMEKRTHFEKATSREMTLRGQDRRLSELISELSTLFSGVKRMLRERLDYQEVVNLSAKMVRQITNCEKMLMVVGAVENEVEIAYVEGAAQCLVGARFYITPGSVIEKLWRTKSSWLVSNPRRELPGVTIPKDFSSLLVAPLEVAKETIGLVVLFDEKENALEGGLVRKMNALRHHVALALEKAVLYSKYEERSITDGLTRLYSRRYFLQRAGDERERAARYKAAFSVAIADLDHFKNCNDRFGHLVGDAVLKATAKVLGEGIEPPSLVCRYGGEEFAYLFVDSEKEEAKARCEEIRRKVAELKIEALEGEKITISFGVASFPGDGENLEELLAQADQALYAAKEGGRNQTCVYERKTAGGKKKH